MPTEPRPPDGSPAETPPAEPSPPVDESGDDAHPRAEADSEDEARLAPHRLRLVAFATDVAVVAVVFVLALVLDKLVGVPAVIVYLTAGVTFIYYLSATTWLMDGQTAGKAVCGLAVRRIDRTTPARSWRGLVWSVGRHSVGYLVADVLGLGALLALVTARRRCLHDYAFNSEVVMVAPEQDEQGASFTARYRHYWEEFDKRYDEVKSNYRWLFAPWKWLTRVALAVASYLTILTREASAAELPPAASAVPPAKALSTKAGVAVWAGTTFTAAAVLSSIAADPEPLDLAGTWEIIQYVETENESVIPSDLLGAQLRLTTLDCGDEPCPVEVSEAWDGARRFQGLRLDPVDGGTVYEARWESVADCFAREPPHELVAEAVYDSTNTLRWERLGRGSANNQLSFTHEQAFTIIREVGNCSPEGTVTAEFIAERRASE